MIKRIDEFIGRAFDTATKHGFHDESTSFEHQLMLVVGEVGEVGELVEADRKNLHANLAGFDKCVGIEYGQRFRDYVKDSVEDELADVCIRLFDMCGYFCVNPNIPKGLDLSKEWDELFSGMSFTEKSMCLVRMLCDDYEEDDKESLGSFFGCALDFIYYWSLDMDIDLCRHIELKMQYNESRGYKHGKRY